MKALRILGFLTLFGTAALAAEAPDMTAGPAPAGKPWESGWGFWPNVPKAWQQTHQGYLGRAKQGNVKVLFLGDSITAGWVKDGKASWAKHYEPAGAVNFGIGGDTTRQILWRIENGVMDGLNPKLVVLMIGVNNLFASNSTTEEVAKGVAEVIKQIQAKSPKSEILLLSVLPLKLEQFDKRVQELNPMIAKLAGKNVTYLDLTENFRGPDGKSIAELYMPDGTHLGAKGYETWAAAMEPVFVKLSK